MDGGCKCTVIHYTTMGQRPAVDPQSLSADHAYTAAWSLRPYKWQCTVHECLNTLYMTTNIIMNHDVPAPQWVAFVYLLDSHDRAAQKSKMKHIHPSPGLLYYTTLSLTSISTLFSVWLITTLSNAYRTSRSLVVSVFIGFVSYHNAWATYKLGGYPILVASPPMYYYDVFITRILGVVGRLTVSMIYDLSI